jgi:hypothetical protein
MQTLILLLWYPRSAQFPAAAQATARRRAVARRVEEAGLGEVKPEFICPLTGAPLRSAMPSLFA